MGTPALGLKKVQREKAGTTAQPEWLKLVLKQILSGQESGPEATAVIDAFRKASYSNMDQPSFTAALKIGVQKDALAKLTSGAEKDYVGDHAKLPVITKMPDKTALAMLTGALVSKNHVLGALLNALGLDPTNLTSKQTEILLKTVGSKNGSPLTKTELKTLGNALIDAHYKTSVGPKPSVTPSQAKVDLTGILALAGGDPTRFLPDDTTPVDPNKTPTQVRIQQLAPPTSNPSDVIDVLTTNAGITSLKKPTQKAVKDALNKIKSEVAPHASPDLAVPLAIPVVKDALAKGVSDADAKLATGALMKLAQECNSLDARVAAHIGAIAATDLCGAASYVAAIRGNLSNGTEAIQKSCDAALDALKPYTKINQALGSKETVKSLVGFLYGNDERAKGYLDLTNSIDKCIATAKAARSKESASSPKQPIDDSELQRLIDMLESMKVEILFGVGKVGAFGAVMRSNFGAAKVPNDVKTALDRVIGATAAYEKLCPAPKAAAASATTTPTGAAAPSTNRVGPPSVASYDDLTKKIAGHLNALNPMRIRSDGTSELKKTWTSLDAKAQREIESLQGIAQKAFDQGDFKTAITALETIATRKDVLALKSTDSGRAILSQAAHSAADLIGVRAKALDGLGMIEGSVPLKSEADRKKVLAALEQVAVNIDGKGVPAIIDAVFKTLGDWAPDKKGALEARKQAIMQALSDPRAKHDALPMALKLVAGYALNPDTLFGLRDVPSYGSLDRTNPYFKQERAAVRSAMLSSILWDPSLSFEDKLFYFMQLMCKFKQEDMQELMDEIRRSEGKAARVGSLDPMCAEMKEQTAALVKKSEEDLQRIDAGLNDSKHSEAKKAFDALEKARAAAADKPDDKEGKKATEDLKSAEAKFTADHPEFDQLVKQKAAVTTEIQEAKEKEKMALDAFASAHQAQRQAETRPGDESNRSVDLMMQELQRMDQTMNQWKEAITKILEEQARRHRQIWS